VGGRQDRPFSATFQARSRITVWRVEDIRALIETGVTGNAAMPGD
jgi:hypothetical protein